MPQNITLDRTGFERASRFRKEAEESALTGERRNDETDAHHKALDAAAPETPIDWRHYVESRLHDFARR